MTFNELFERAESFHKTYSGSSYNNTPDVTGFMGQVSAGSNGIIPIKFPNFSEYPQKKLAKKKKTK